MNIFNHITIALYETKLPAIPGTTVRLLPIANRPELERLGPKRTPFVDV